MITLIGLKTFSFVKYLSLHPDGFYCKKPLIV